MIGLKVSWGSLLCLLICLHGSVAAQVRGGAPPDPTVTIVPWDSVPAFPKARVRLNAGSFSFEGRPIGFSADTLTLLGSTRDSLKIPVDHIRRLEVAMGAKNRASSTILGALVGAAAGFGLTWGISYLYYEQAGYTEVGYGALIAAYKGGSVGGLAGALTGFVLGGPDWREVRLVR